MTKIVDVTSGRLAPGQTETHKFPRVGESASTPEARNLGRWRLEVRGLVETPLTLTLDDVLALPQQRLRADIHCVTSWSQLGMMFEGTPLALLLAQAAPLSAARFIRFIAYSEREHDTSLPLDVATADTWLIHGYDGQPLTPEHGYPLRTVTPSRYFYKSLKWLRRIELLADDELGYWERESSYHNVADPWAGDQRFTTGSIKPEMLARFRAAASFARYRGPRKVLVGLDLRGWKPRTCNLGDLYLKSCDLREADLAGADLPGANLSLSDLRGANLRAANLRGADLEGANFEGADLRDADLRDTQLSATKLQGARVAGLRWSGSRGLLESEEAFLVARPAPSEDE